MSYKGVFKGRMPGFCEICKNSFGKLSQHLRIHPMSEEKRLQMQEEAIKRGREFQAYYHVLEEEDIREAMTVDGKETLDYHLVKPLLRRLGHIIVEPKVSHFHKWTCLLLSSDRICHPSCGFLTNTSIAAYEISQSKSNWTHYGIIFIVKLKRYTSSVILGTACVKLCVCEVEFF